jgi:hypothetical protein
MSAANTAAGCENGNAMRLTELFEAGDLCRCSDGLQSAGYFVVAEFSQC